MAKTEYIGIRTTPEIKKIIKKLAEEGFRTISQQVDMILIEWLRENSHLKKSKK
jgi:hypothetical protein